MKKIYLFFLAFCFSAASFGAQFFVDPTITTAGDGLSWEKAFKTIETAISAANADDDIRIKQGTFAINTAILIDKNLNFHAGYPKANTGTDLSGFDPFANAVVVTPISSKIVGISLFVIGGADGFVINIDGFQFLKGGVSTSEEGAIYIKQTATLNLKRCVFEGNKSNKGSAIYAATNADVTIDGCVFYKNDIVNNGVGYFCVIQLPTLNSNLTISNSVFASNIGLDGTANDAVVYCNGTLSVYNSTFFNNTKHHYQLYNANGATSVSSKVYNCIFDLNDNSGTYVPMEFGTKGDIYNCYFEFNNTLYQIAWGNDKGGNLDKNAVVFLKSSNLVGIDGKWGTTDDGLQLVSGSALIDKGLNIGTNTDLIGGVRTGLFDIGAYEFNACKNPLTVTLATDNALATGGECGDLRFAINFSENNPVTLPAKNQIDIKISTAAPYVIKLQAPLPVITKDVIINGRNQTGYQNITGNKDDATLLPDYKLAVEIDGEKKYDYGLQVTAGNFKLRGVSIGGFKTAGIFVKGVGIDSLAIEGCYIGLRPDGTINANGIGVDIDLAGVTSKAMRYVGGGSRYDCNFIAGNTTDGIRISNAKDFYVIRNIIGLDTEGKTVTPNGGFGVNIVGSTNVSVGYDGFGLGNVISGNALGQVSVNSSTGTQFYKNRIGVAFDGTTAVNNPNSGITFSDSKNSIIGSEAFPNIIANSTDAGIKMIGTSSTSNKIISNSIYTNKVGIDIASVSQDGILQPVINTATLNGDRSANFVLAAPATLPNIKSVSFYADADNGTQVVQGKVFLTTLNYSSTNTYTLNADTLAKAGSLTKFTAIQTSSSGSSSEFSDAATLAPYTPPTQPLGNRGLYFDGVDDYATIPASVANFSGSSNFTIEMWVKNQGLGGQLFNKVVNGGSGPFAIWTAISNSGAVVFNLANNGNAAGWDVLTTNASLESNKWYHIAFEKQGSFSRIYINGAKAAERTLSGATTAGTADNITDINLGRFRRNNNNYFKGQLDELRISNIARYNGADFSPLGVYTVDANTPNLYHFDNTLSNNQVLNDEGSTPVNGVKGSSAATVINDPLWALRVTDNTDNSTAGLGSLRQAITEANTDADQDYIDFSVGDGIQTIKPTSTYTLSTPVLIDGFSQYNSTIGENSTPNSNAFGLPINSKLNVIINGANAGTNNAFLFTREYAVVKGLVVNGYTNSIAFNFNDSGQTVNYNKISGCFIGTDRNGIQANANNVGFSATQTSVNRQYNVIGGSTDADRNLISGNNYGISDFNYWNDGTIQNNYIGTNANGTAAIPNQNGGINSIIWTKNCTITDNIISGNIGNALVLGSTGIGNITIKRNRIGTSADGSASLPNTGIGIQINDLNTNTIGGALNDANIIANNGGIGILISNSSANKNKISRNSIFNNSTKGISLVNGNNNKIAPIITSATPTSISGTGVTGDSIEVFANVSPFSGKVQGKTYLQSTKVVGGKWSITGTFTLNDSITATATDAVIGTSEFSGAKVVASCGAFVVTSIADAGVGTLRQAILDANAVINCTGITINVTTTGTITLASPLPAITSPLTINGNGIEVSGDNKYSVFIINNAIVTIKDLTIANGLAKGGNGQNAVTNGTGGGGGAGLGGGLAIFGTSSDVGLTNVIFSNNKAIGGNGGAPAWSFSGTSGAGGMGSVPLISGAPGAAGGNNSPGSNGGLFSGGGGAGHITTGAPKGGNGGLFAGGGGTGIPNPSGAGSCPAPVGLGGSFAGNGGISCGGSNPNGGGGGAGLGGALFVYQGNVTISNVQFRGNQAVGGLKGANAGNGQGKGSAIFVYTGATITANGGNVFNGNLSSDALCLPLDNHAYYNANNGAVDFFPAQAPYALSKAGPSTQTHVNLTWSTCVSKPITEYILEKSVNDTLGYTIIQSGSTINTYSDNTLTANNTYFYRVKALTVDGGSGEYSHLVVSTFKKAGSGTAVKMDGIDDYIDFKDLNMNTSGGFTISFWANPTSATNYSRFVDFGNGPASDNILICRSGTSADLLFQVYKGAGSLAYIIASNALELNVWQHFAAVYNNTSNQLLLYKNGILLGQTTVPAALIDLKRSKSYLGKSNWNDPNYQGSLDQLCIWEKALTVSEIQQYMCRKLKGNESGLRTNLMFDEGQGYGAENKSLNGIGAFLMNTPTWALSGAAIGDTSTNIYDASNSLVLINDKLKVDFQTLNLNQGIQIYKVNESPSQTGVGTGLDSLHLKSYFGVFPIGITQYKASYNYTDNGNLNGKSYENSMTCAKRLDNSVATWDKMANTTLDVTSNILATPVLTGRNEIIVAFAEPPVPGAALDFDGVDNIVTIPDGKIDLANKSFTIEFWAKRNSTSSQDIIIGQGVDGAISGSLHLGFRDDNFFTFAFYADDLDISLLESSSTAWHHWACVFDVTTKQKTIYVDGVLKGSGIANGNYIGSGFVNLGANAWRVFENAFNGSLDEVRLWNRALCGLEIKNNMYCDNLASKAGLLAQYSFNQGIAGGDNSTETIAIDSSGNGNNGILSNTFKFKGATSNWIALGAVKSDSVCKPMVLPAGTNWTWTGTESKDWFSPCNWDMLSVPNLTSDVIILGGTTYQPTIAGANMEAQCNTITIKTTNKAMVTLDKTKGATLKIGK